MTAQMSGNKRKKRNSGSLDKSPVVNTNTDTPKINNKLNDKQQSKEIKMNTKIRRATAKCQEPDANSLLDSHDHKISYSSELGANNKSFYIQSQDSQYRYQLKNYWTKDEVLINYLINHCRMRN